MCARLKRGPQALSADRRQARPMALRGTSAPVAAAHAAPRQHVSRGPRRPLEAALRESRGAAGALADEEPAAGQALRLAAAALPQVLRPGPSVPRSSEPELTWSDRERAAADVVLREHDRLAGCLRGRLGLERDEDADALLQIEFAWRRYPDVEDTADVAALFPVDLHGLSERRALLELPRWRRLRLPSPARRRPLADDKRRSEGAPLPPRLGPP